VDGKKVIRVEPSQNDIYALKKAVKAELESGQHGLIVDALAMQVKKHDGTVCDMMSAPLEANTEEMAYVVTLSS
jgi:hypothetical protein